MSSTGEIARRRQRDPPGLLRSGPRPAGNATRRRRLRSATGPVLVASVLAVCIALRFLARSDLWRDEALSVNIARLPLPSLFEALRHDGSPPLYYVILHGWMRWFGTGDLAVRTLSGVFSVLALPLAWEVGRRAGGRNAGWSLLLLLASSPFAVRYATETRMYALIVPLSLLAYLAWTQALQQPSAGRLLLLACTTGLLLLTHYWAFYLVGAMLGATALRARAGSVLRFAPAAMRDVVPMRRAATRTAVGLMCGAIPFLPWLPSFLFQLQHTGTPWGSPPDARTLVVAIKAWSAAGTTVGLVLAWTLVLPAIVGLFGPRRSRPAHEPEWPHGRDLCFIGLGTFVLAIVAGEIFGVSLAIRYTAVVLPLFLLLAALGLRSIPPAARAVVLGVAVTCGIAGSVANVSMKRTQAGDVARVLKTRAGPGDVVVYCPDQLGPSVSRLMPARVQQLTFPDFGAPELVDWVDYARRNSARDPAAFAQSVDRQAAAGRVWLVYSGRYKPAGAQCADFTKDLAALRPPQKVVLRPDRSAYERGWLLLYEPTSG